MKSALQHKNYSPEISLYYQNGLSDELVEEIVQFVWLNQSSTITPGFDLVREIRSKVYRLKFRDETYYLKSYTPQTMSKLIKNYFRPADAIRYFEMSTKLSQANIAVAQPVLAITRKRKFLPPDSIFVTREVPGIDLHTFILQEAQYDPVLRKEIITQLADIWSRLIKHNFAHQDPSLNNFIVHPGQRKDDFQIEMIDVDNIYYRPLFSQKLLLQKNIKKFKWQLSVTDLTFPQSEFDSFIAELQRNL